LCRPGPTIGILLSMQVNALDHVNIRTKDLEGSVRFYAEVLGLRSGNPPSMVTPSQARWLYDKADRPIIHLRLFDSEPGPTGSIDHVALRCEGKTELLDRLKRMGAEFSAYETSPTSTVILTRDPHGVMLELYFPGG
jgi:catechol 2,3-dioxygenase-like lactoylglutathione lyase family enzyme